VLDILDIIIITFQH